LVAILVLFAIAISIVRGYPSIYQKYLPTIQDNISSILGKPVQVDSIRIDWFGFSPQVTARNLSIFESEDRYDQLLNVDKAVISIDTYKSLIRRNVTFRELTFIGGNLEAVRTLDESIILNGIDISERLAARKKLNQENKLKINLLDSSISITDEINRLDYFFDRVDVVLGFSGDSFKVSSKFILPQTLGESFILSADIRDLDKGFKNIRGKLYTKGENINLELIDDFFPRLRVGVRKGNSDFQLWGNFNSLKQRTFVGNWSLRDLVYKDIEVPIKYAKDQEEIIAIDTKFQLVGEIEDWQLALNEVSIKTADDEWPGEKYELSCIDCSRNNYILTAAFDHLNTDQLYATAQHFPFISERLNEVLDTIEVHGILQASQMAVQFKDNQLAKYTYKASLQDANISIPEQEIHVTSIVGEVDGNHRHGELDLVCDALGLQLNKVLNQPLIDHKIQGVVSWQHVGDRITLALEDMVIAHKEMTATAQGLVQVIGDKPLVDIQLEVPLAEAETIKQYLPYKKMKPKLSKWLSESITAGTLTNGRLLFQGDPRNFPFKDKPGKFEVVGQVDDGVLDYRPDWPSATNISADFLIKNKYLEVNADQGTILDSTVHKVHAYIEDLKLPTLVIDGSASGPANNIFTYLQESSLLSKESRLFKHISAKGNTNLDLNIILTLSKKLEKKRLVSGMLELDDAELTVNAVSLPFTNLKGRVRFDKEGAEGTGLTANLFGAPVHASASKTGDGRTLISASGDLNLDHYLAKNYTKLQKYLKGNAPLTAEVNIPRLGKNSTDRSVSIKVKSDLYGVTTSLPKPFKKDFDEIRNLTISTKHNKNTDSKVYANLEDQVFLQANIKNESSKISNMEVRLGDQQFSLPDSGIKISGSTQNLDLAEWRALMGSEQEQDIEVKEIDLLVNQVEVGSLNLENVAFKARKNSQFWVGNIDSSVAKGRFEYPLDTNTGSVATADFDYLRFNPSENKLSEPTNFDPRTLPTLVVIANEFQFKKSKFNNLSLKTKPSANGLTIDSLQGNGSDMQVSASGTWEVLNENLQQTNLAITLHTDNMQNSLNGLGFDSAVEGGHGTVAANFSWPKAPYQFSLDAVAGTAKLRFNEGSISSVEPGGAGRLVGLFNLGEITRRLSLDFTDFFSKGYKFEKIRADLEFKEANLTTENLKIKGPSADILIQGRTGITAKDYDQVVTVTPHVSGGLPWIGLAVGGPLGAVGVIVGEKIAKSMGVDVNKVTEVQYSLTGSWAEPVIEPIAQRVAGSKSTSPAVQGQPSPNSYPQAPSNTPTAPNQNRVSP